MSWKSFWKGVGRAFEHIGSAIVGSFELVGDWLHDIIIDPVFNGNTDAWTGKNGYYEKLSNRAGSYYDPDRWGLFDGKNRKMLYEEDQARFAKTKMQEINQKYNLGLSDKEIEDASANYGVKKAWDKYGDYFSFSGSIGDTMSKTIASNVKNLFDQHTLALKNSSIINNLDEQQFKNQKFIIEKSLEKQKRDNLTEILMKNPFAIMANGSLYKKGRPGTKSYDPLTPWEPYKYITGDIKPDEFNDILMGRSHLKLAGNRDYYSNVWDKPEWITPDRDRKNRHLQNYIHSRYDQLNKGFKELAPYWYSGEADRDARTYAVSNLENVAKNLKVKMPKFFKSNRYSNGDLTM